MWSATGDAYFRCSAVEQSGGRSPTLKHFSMQSIQRCLAPAAAMQAFRRKVSAFLTSKVFLNRIRGKGESRILTPHNHGAPGSGAMQTAAQRATAALHRMLHLKQSHILPSTSVKAKGKINLSTLGWFGSGAVIDTAAQTLIATRMTPQTLSSCMFASQRSRWCSGSLMIS